MDAILIDCAGNTALGGASQRFAQTRIVLGRDANCDLRFDAERELQVSSEHAAIERDADGLLLIDLGAANGVYYQGERIDGQVRIEAGAEIRLGPGGPKLTARIGGTGAPATMVVEAPAILQASTTSPAVTPRAERKVGIGAATMRTALNTATKHERKRFLVLLTLVALPLLAIAGWAAYAAHSSSSDAARVGERLTAAEQENVSLLTGIDSLTDELTRVENDRGLDAAQRRELAAATQAELDRLRAELSAAQEALRDSGDERWASTVEQYADSIFLCVAVEPDTRRVGIGTAFCIGRDGLLATNAHVAEMLQAHKVRWIIQNRTGRVCEVRNIIAHPDFEGAASPDLGLIRIETDKLDGDPAALPLASTDAAANLGVGTHVGTIGFPGELQRNYLNRIDKKTQRFESVLATFKDGWVGRLTTYDGRHNDPAKHVLIQHSASLSGGTSGSPMFLHDGTVVAISNSSISQRLAARDPNTSGPSLLSAAEIGFAIRVDELTRFAKVIPWARDRLP